MTESSLAALEARLGDLGSVVVAWSGGADSSLLAFMAHRVLGPEKALAVTAVSPSLPSNELDDCRALAAEWGLAWEVVITDELDRPEYRANAGDRCAHCKHALLDASAPLAEVRGATVCLGVIVDDLGDDRPGQVVAARRGTAFPLVEAGFGKEQVRAASRALGLRTANKPAAACLASRIPRGTEVSLELLGKVERAERALRALGYGLVQPMRVRHAGAGARVELAGDDLERALKAVPEVVAAVKAAAGYDSVLVAPEGYRSAV